MIVKVILHNLNDDIFIVSNSDKDVLQVKENSIYVNKSYGCFVEGSTLIETFDKKEECTTAYNSIKKFINERKNIRETINLTLRDIKNTDDIKQKEMLEKFVWIMESKFLKYDHLYLKDII